jgi:hypothetical protein
MKRIIALVGAAALATSLGVASASAAPKSSPANCTGKTVSAHTKADLASGPTLVNAVKAFCWDGTPFHS